MVWERKGIRIRLAAAGIDAVVVVSLGLTLAWLLGPAGAVLGAAAALAYPMCEILTARSPGKWLLGLRVSDADSTSASRRQLVRRAGRRYVPHVVWAVIQLAALAVPLAVVVFAGAVVAAAAAVLVVGRHPWFVKSRQFEWDVQAKTAVLGPAPSPPRTRRPVRRPAAVDLPWAA